MTNEKKYLMDLPLDLSDADLSDSKGSEAEKLVLDKPTSKETGKSDMFDAQTKRLPVLALRDIVVFPHMIAPLFVGREKSVKALEQTSEKSRQVSLVTQKDPDQDNPTKDDLYAVGTIGSVLQMLKLPDGTVKVLVEGSRRAKILSLDEEDGHLTAEIEPVTPETEQEGSTRSGLAALSRACLSQFESFIKLHKKIPRELLDAMAEHKDDPSHMADTLAAHMPVKLHEKQTILEMIPLTERFELIFQYLTAEIDVLEVERKIRKRVKGQMEKNQRDYYLNEQMKAIQKELGDDEFSDVSEWEDKINKANLPKDVKERAKAEIRKLKAMNPMAAEATVVRNYLDWLVETPWKKRSRLSHDLTKAEEVLEADHYGLEKVKERIIEHLAVHKRTKGSKSPIICLVGPPGVGKTSLGTSVAKATGRKFVRMALGGVRDEAEIRGHRRTYIGALPGKIIQGLRKAGTNNPVFLLDEVDKMGMDFRGDPSSALLEVLDPEQNKAFGDHYLELDVDLSNVMFICTANSLDIPRPLLDRMEIIRIPGYTQEEKTQIAQRHLISKQMTDHGLTEDELVMPDATLDKLMVHYTREAGVRNLEKQIANLCRKVVKKLDAKDHDIDLPLKLEPSMLKDYAGVPKFKASQIEDQDMMGVTTGLAWTEVGGDLLSIEAVTMVGEGKITMTGKLGDVMKESVTAANMLIKSRAASFGLEIDKLNKTNVHIHVPEGATPKDGPSAGIAMVTSIISVLTQNPIRRDIAMTGEITLRGKVFPIGGLKEKLLAAQQGGVKTVLIPEDNVKDLEDIPESVKESLEIISVTYIDQVLDHALCNPIVPIDPHKEGYSDKEKPEISKKTPETSVSERLHH